MRRLLAVTVALPMLVSPAGAQQLGRVYNGDQTWFVNLQLRNPILVRIDNAPICAAERVVFRTFGNAAAAPDTVWGQMMSPPGNSSVMECLAPVSWRLGPDVGTQRLQITFVPAADLRAAAEARARATVSATRVNASTEDNPATTRIAAAATAAGVAATLPIPQVRIANATARRTARVFVGLGVTHDQADFDVLRTEKDSIRVLRNDTTFLQEVSSSTPGRSDNREALRPYVGVDFPIRPSWESIRLSIATEAKAFDRHFWAGISLLQFVFKEHMEATAIDLHFGTFFSRRDVLTDRVACEAAPSSSTCKVETRLKWDGLGVMATVDGSAIIGVLTKALGLS